MEQIVQGIQRQEQKMSQAQIQSLDLLALPVEALQQKITEAALQNPALEVLDQPLGALHANDTAQTLHVTGIKGGNKSISAYRAERTVPVSANSIQEADNFQAFLENVPQDETETLYGHLLAQLSFCQLDKATRICAERIIQNLDANGFHCVPLSELFATELNDTAESTRMLGISKPHATIRSALHTVRALDPIGCAVADIQQSLIVQAKLTFRLKDRTKIYDHALDILEHHFEYLHNARSHSLARAISRNKTIPYTITQQEAANILSVIASLEPFPGRAYPSTAEHDPFIIPTAYIEQSGRELYARMNQFELPLVQISTEFKEIKTRDTNPEAAAYTKECIKQAKVFIGSLNQREKTIFAVLQKITMVQKKFFLSGDRKTLQPLTRRQIADELGIHESTVSRAVSKKYISCRWGLFEIQSFFSGAVAQSAVTATAAQPAVYSQEGVKDIIKQLLEESCCPLSDQKIADILKTRYHLHIARRTVTKYRTRLNIASSYDRKQ